MISTEQLVPTPEYLDEAVPAVENILINTVEASEVGSSTPRAGFVERMTSVPLVTATWDQIGRVYASGRDSNRILRFGANTMEYSVRLVAGTFEPQLRSLDDYAGRQLEFIGNRSRSVVEGIAGWTLTAEIQTKLESTILGLRNAESYIDLVLERLRTVATQVHEGVDGRLENWSESCHAREVEAEIQVQRLRREIVQTLRGVVDLINMNGYLLPLPGQEKLKGFLLSLPARFTDSDSLTQGQSRAVLLANESVILIRSLINVLSRYLSWVKPSESVAY
jgi:hypothetical protein